MSACDTCSKPGACCRGLALSNERGAVTFWADEPQLAVLAWLASMALPFVVANESRRWSNEEGREYVSYHYDCPMLGGDGRCTIYDERPELCRTYEAKSDLLCVMHEAAA